MYIVMIMEHVNRDVNTYYHLYEHSKKKCEQTSILKVMAEKMIPEDGYILVKMDPFCIHKHWIDLVTTVDFETWYRKVYEEGTVSNSKAVNRRWVSSSI